MKASDVQGCAAMQKASTFYWWAVPKCDKHRNTMDALLSKTVDYILWCSPHKGVGFISMYLIFCLNAQTLPQDPVRLRK